MMSRSFELAEPLAVAKTSRVAWRSLMENDWLISGLLVVLTAIPAIALWRYSAYLTGDSYQYLRGALTFSSGQGFRDMSGQPFTFMSPLYPLVVGLIHRLNPAGNIETTARLVSFVGASAAVVAFYRLVRVRYAFWIALVAALLFALLPLRVWSGSWILSEGLFLGLVMVGLAVLFTPVKKSWLIMFGGGLLLGFAYLTRPEALAAIAVIAVLFWFDRTPRWKRLLPFLLGALIVALPYHAWAYRATGQVNSGRLSLLFAQSESFHQGLGPQFVHSHQVDATGSSLQQRTADMSLRGIATRYAFFARWEANRVIYDLGPYWIVFGILVVGLIGLATRARQILRELWSAGVWQVSLLPMLLILPFLHIEDRYFLQALPVLLLWLVLIVSGAYTIAKVKLPTRFANLAVLIPLGFVALFTFSYVLRLTTQITRRDSSLLARQTAQWLDAQRFSAASTLSQTPDFAFFSNSQHVWMASGDAENVITYAKRSGAQYIYVSTQDVRTPLTNALLNDPAQAPPTVRLLHEEADGVSRSRLFQIN